MMAGVVRSSDAIHRDERDGFHQVGPVEQHTAGHVPRGAVREARGAAQGSPLPPLRAHQGADEALALSLARRLDGFVDL